MKNLLVLLALTLPVAPAFSAPSLNEVMKSHHLGKPISSLNLGKPIDSTPVQQTFLIGSCPVEIGLEGAAKKVKSITATDLAKCPGMKLEEYFGADSQVLPARLTFGQFKTLLSNKAAHFSADCLSLCGNGYEPMMHLSWMPSAASGLSASSTMIDDSSVLASEKWREEVERKYGDDYVVDGKFNCTNEFDSKVANFLKDVKVTSITIGQPGYVYECTRR